MALRRNSLLLAALAAAALVSPALAEDYAVNYMSHSDSITIGLGDAPTANIIIQHPTPWPRYVNDTNIPVSAAQGISALNNMMQRYMQQSSDSNATDTGTSGSSGMSGASAGVAAGAN